jgi:WD40 repeat protein
MWPISTVEELDAFCSKKESTDLIPKEIDPEADEQTQKVNATVEERKVEEKILKLKKLIYAADNLDLTNDNSQIIKEIQHRWWNLVHNSFSKHIYDGSDYIRIADNSLQVKTSPSMRPSAHRGLSNILKLFTKNMDNIEKLTQQFKQETSPPAHIQYSSTLARFTAEYKNYKPSYDAKPDARNLVEARCDRGGEHSNANTVMACNFSGNYGIVTGGCGHRSSNPCINVYDFTAQDVHLLEITGSLSPSGADHIDNLNGVAWFEDSCRVQGVPVDQNANERYTLRVKEAKSILSMGNRIYVGLDKSKVQYWDIDTLRLEQDVFNANGDEEDLLTQKEIEKYYDYDLDNDLELHAGQACTGEFDLDMLYGKPSGWGASDPDSVNYLLGRPGNIAQVYYGSQRSYHFGLFDLNQQKMQRIFLGHTSHILGLYVKPELPDMIGSTSFDESAKLWDSRASSACVFTLRGHNRQPSALDYTLIDGIPFAFTGGSDEGIRVWDLRLGTCLYELSTGNSTVHGIYYHNTSNTLYASVESNHQDDNYMDGDDYDSEMDEDSDDERYDSPWPTQAVHGRYDFEEYYMVDYCSLISYNFKNAPEQPIKHRRPNPPPQKKRRQ